MKNFHPPYHVDFHSERGEVTIYVTDADGKDVWYADTDAVNELVEDGFISTRGFAMGRNVRPDVLERSVLDYLREVGVITNALHESRRYFADEQDSLYDENPRRRNPGDVHIDIHSHNTRGRGVRLNNPDMRSSAYPAASVARAARFTAKGELHEAENEIRNAVEYFVNGGLNPDEAKSSVIRICESLRDGGLLDFMSKDQKKYFFDLVTRGIDGYHPNPTQTDVENWTERYRASVQKRVDGVPSQAQYVVKIVTTKGETAFLRVGKGTKFDTDANSARVYRSGEKANEAATKVSNWLKKKNPAKWKAIKSISAEPKK